MTMALSKDVFITFQINQIYFTQMSNTAAPVDARQIQTHQVRIQFNDVWGLIDCAPGAFPIQSPVSLFRGLKKRRGNFLFIYFYPLRPRGDKASRFRSPLLCLKPGYTCRKPRGCADLTEMPGTKKNRLADLFHRDLLPKWKHLLTWTCSLSKAEVTQIRCYFLVLCCEIILNNHYPPPPKKKAGRYIRFWRIRVLMIHNRL